jgi:hypothetical protein
MPMSEEVLRRATRNVTSRAWRRWRRVTMASNWRRNSSCP